MIIYIKVICGIPFLFYPFKMIQEKMSSLDLGKYKIEFDTIIQEYIRTAIQEYEVRDTLRLMLGNHSIKNALFVKSSQTYLRIRTV